MGAGESFSPDDWVIVEKVWDSIERNLAEFTRVFFLCLYSENPNMADYFPFTGGNDEAFQMHTEIFLKDVHRWVELYKTDRSKLLDILRVTGIEHAKRHIDRQQFVAMRSAFVKTAVAGIGERHLGGVQEKTALNRALTLPMEEIIAASDYERIRLGVGLY